MTTERTDIPGRTGSHSHVVVERDAEILLKDGTTVTLQQVVDERAEAMARVADAFEAGQNVHLTEEGEFEIDETP